MEIWISTSPLYLAVTRVYIRQLLRLLEEFHSFYVKVDSS